MRNPFKRKDTKVSVSIELKQDKFQFIIEVDADSGAVALKTINPDKQVPLGVIAQSLLAMRDTVVGQLVLEREKSKERVRQQEKEEDDENDE